MKPRKPDSDTKWLHVKLPKSLHDRLAKAAIDLEDNMAGTVITLLKRALKLTD